MLPLKADFMDSLRQYGKLPVTKLSLKWEDTQELSYYRDLRNSFFPSKQKSIYSKPTNKYRQHKNKQSMNLTAFNEVEELKDALTGFLSAKLDSDQKEELQLLVINLENKHFESQRDLKAQKLENMDLKNQLSSKDYEQYQKETDLKNQLKDKDYEHQQQEADLKNQLRDKDYEHKQKEADLKNQLRDKDYEHQQKEADLKNQLRDKNYEFQAKQVVTEKVTDYSDDLDQAFVAADQINCSLVVGDQQEETKVATQNDEA